MLLDFPKRFVTTTGTDVQLGRADVVDGGGLAVDRHADAIKRHRKAIALTGEVGILPDPRVGRETLPGDRHPGAGIDPGDHRPGKAGHADPVADATHNIGNGGSIFIQGLLVDRSRGGYHSIGINVVWSDGFPGGTGVQPIG